MHIKTEIKKKQSLRTRLYRIAHSKKWGFPLRFATLVTTVLFWAIYLMDHGEDKTRINGNNRSWLLTGTLMITLPTMGMYFYI